ncbi:MAG: flagellar basal body-associated FliL family protein [Blastocatellia bacterium]|nr:flagellar basal body-associated FliL family protein [Blastocatellia bacterium]
MSDSAAVEQPSSPAAPKKSPRKFLIIALAIVVLGGGGAGGYFYLQSSKAAAKGPAEKSKKAAPAEEAEEEPAENEETGKEKSGKSESAGLSLPDDSAVKQVIELQPFIVNLTDQEGSRYLRLTVSLGIGGEEAEAKPSPLFTTRIRNALLAVLTTRSSEEVLRPEGKLKLRKDLLRAARAASEEPRVEAIYITEFIVQL